MSSLDNQDIFGSGPHTIRPGAPRRELDRRSFAGVDGELILDMGLRGREIIQQGRLQAGTFNDLNTQISEIEQLLDGQLHTLTDNYGKAYSHVIVEHFEPSTPVRKGRDFWCEYTIRYRQLP